MSSKGPSRQKQKPNLRDESSRVESTKIGPSEGDDYDSNVGIVMDSNG